MEITSISGPDIVPQSSIIQAPREEVSPQHEPSSVNSRVETSENNKGTIIDTYA